MVHPVKNLPELQESGLRSLDQDDPLEKGMLPTPVFLPEEFHGTEEPGELQSMGL